MPTRLLLGYSLLALVIATLVAIAVLALRRRRQDYERRYGKRRLS